MAVIGRNEGERLKVCLRSVLGQCAHVVYVDSGSTDHSVAFARSQGVEVVELDGLRPFTAARARNAGAARLLELAPDLEYVQFIDGDCELRSGWLEDAANALRARSGLAAVCGRLRERNRNASIYNRLCDLEWDRPAGPTDACGGIAMMRVKAFVEAGGFNPDLVCGEEPELCLRLRRRGWGIERLATDMAVHDAAMTRFGQWWRRASRSGYAYAQGAWRYGRSSAGSSLRPVMSIALWSGLVPLLILGTGLLMPALAVLPALAYAVQYRRMAGQQRRRGICAADARLYAVFTLLGKFAQSGGVLRFLLHRIARRRPVLMEYKSPVVAGRAVIAPLDTE